MNSSAGACACGCGANLSIHLRILYFSDIWPNKKASRLERSLLSRITPRKEGRHPIELTQTYYPPTHPPARQRERPSFHLRRATRGTDEGGRKASPIPSLYHVPSVQSSGRPRPSVHQSIRASIHTPLSFLLSHFLS